MADAAPKSKHIQADIKRIKRYVAQHPGCSLRDMAEVLGIAYTSIRAWKTYGYYEHETAFEIRARGGQPGPDVIENPLSRKNHDELKREQKQKAKNPLAGAVVLESPDVTTIQAIAGDERASVSPDENIKVGTLRNQIKHRIQASLHDAQAVSQYAAALKALAGVQDVELEELYEQEKIIRIYCPAEKPSPDEVVEVDPIEY